LFEEAGILAGVHSRRQSGFLQGDCEWNS
jgi:hypothetical protein